MPNNELEKLLFKAVAKALEVDIDDAPAAAPTLILPVERRPRRTEPATQIAARAA